MAPKCEPPVEAGAATMIRAIDLVMGFRPLGREEGVEVAVEVGMFIRPVYVPPVVGVAGSASLLAGGMVVEAVEGMRRLHLSCAISALMLEVVVMGRVERRRRVCGSMRILRGRRL